MHYPVIGDQVAQRDKIALQVGGQNNSRGGLVSLEEGWRTGLTALDAAMRKALSYGDHGGQVSWTSYEEEYVW